MSWRRFLSSDPMSSDTAPDVRNTQPSPSPGESEAARRIGKPLADQPTIITSSSPTPPPAISDSAYRILEGRVMPGDRLGHFELVEYVGGGGMGRVFRAIDTRLGRTVALKVLVPDQATDADALQRFQNEAQSSARLDHDNIARVYYVGEERGLSFIVFEFIEGVNVRLLVERRGALPLAEAVSYTLQVAEALAHADARRVIHRDIKPSNVLISPEGRVKLIDMGLARLRQADPAVADLTASGVTLGTFDYISPEQARDPRNADIRSDIYSLGCTLFFMLAGQPPFPEGTVLQKLLQHQGDQAPEIRQFRADLPEESSRILRKMMAKDPRHRYAGPAELVADLLLLAEQIGLRPMSPTSRIWLTPQEPSVPFLQRHLPWIAPVAALVCIVLLLDFFWSSPRPSGNTEGEIDAVAVLPQKTSPPPTPAPAGSRSPGAVAPEKQAKPPESKLTNRPNAAGLAIGSSRGGLSLAEEGLPLPGMVTAGENNVPATGDGVVPDSDPVDHSTSPDVVNPRRSGVLIVSETPEGENEFSSLEAACAAARNGETIELRFNGPREEQPMKISNLHVTIRSGEGYTPVLVFRPLEINPIKYPRSMFTLTAGRLTMTGVTVELYVPREVPADSWSLLETWGGQTVCLQGCVFTVCNASDQMATYHQEVAFIRAQPAPDASAPIVGVPMATPLATIELVDFIARGEAVFLRVEDLQPVHLMWDNGVLATTDQLLAANGGQVASKPDEMLRIELRHVTAAVRGGLCRLTNTPSSPYQLTVQFLCTDNIFLTSPGTPLVEQEGTVSVEKSRQWFVWNGDRNYYPDADLFWAVRNIDPEIPPEMMTYDVWRTYWGPSRENQSSRDPLLWKQSPNVNRPLHTHTPADYTLEDPTFGDAPNGAPGFRGDRLSPTPSDPLLDWSTRAGTFRRGIGGRFDEWRATGDWNDETRENLAP